MMAELLNRPTGGEHSASNSSSSSSITLPVSAQPGFGGSPQSPNEIKTSVPGSMIGKQRRTETSGSPSDGQEVQRYFELCLNHDSLEKRLGEINLTKVRNDGELFDKIRVRYAEIRGPRINRLYLLKPVGVHYVRVCHLPVFNVLPSWNASLISHSSVLKIATGSGSLKNHRAGRQRKKWMREGGTSNTRSARHQLCHRRHSCITCNLPNLIATRRGSHGFRRSSRSVCFEKQRNCRLHGVSASLKAPIKGWFCCFWVLLCPLASR